MNPLLIHVGYNLPFYFYALVFLLLAKIFYQSTSKINFSSELLSADNPAFGVCMAGYLIGAGIALTGAFPDLRSVSYPEGLWEMTLGGALAVALMRASAWINDWLILDKFKVQEEMIRDRNVGTGVAVAGNFIATGLLLAAALTGQSSSPLYAIRDSVVYWIAGQAFLVVGAHIFYKVSHYDLEKCLAQGDTAAGISLGGFLVALGLILWASIKGAGSNLVAELITAACLAVVSGVVLIFCTILTEKLILPRMNLAKEVSVAKNSAAGLISAAAAIVTALFIASAIIPR
jgi:uncharacterized membrane protein YjfL (UPF0719 family)